MIDNRIVLLHPLTFIQEEEGVNIGRFGTDTFAVFPEEGAEIIRLLQNGMTIAEVSRWYQEKYKEELDIQDFLNTLRELTFLREEQEDASGLLPVKGQKLGAWMFSPAAWIIYAGLFALAMWMMIQMPSLVPHREQVYFSPMVTLVMLGLFIGQVPGILLHESMHMLAARRIGIPSKLGIGRRMYIFVFEASMPGIWGVPRRQRYLPLMAGMLGDIIWFSILVVSAGFIIQIEGQATFISLFFSALAFSTVLRFIWQFYFYLRTDIYYLIITFFGCINLEQTTKQYLSNAWFRLRGQTDKLVDEANWYFRDRQVARWYSFVYAAGWVLMVGLLLYMLPIIVKILWNTFHELLYGANLQFWDSVTFLGINTLQYGLVLYIYLKERKTRKRTLKYGIQEG